MIKHHVLKLNKEFAIAKSKGEKSFEIRFNDRDYKVGDIVTYTVPDSPSLNNLFERLIFRIEYITDYEQKNGYIVWSEREVFLSYSRDDDIE